jgi:long-chain acyl-CoA synthetase
MRTRLHADPAGVFVHSAVLASCRRNREKIALIDTSLSPTRRISYAEYGSLVETAARGLVAAGLHPDEIIAIFLPNSWEFCVAYHAATLAGAVPTVVNPSYRQRELHYQLNNSGAAFLITDGSLISGIPLDGLPALRRVYCTRQPAAGTEDLASLLAPSRATLPEPIQSPEEALAALPYSSGTTGLPKGVMLSHSNLLTNVFQYLAPGERSTYTPDEILLCLLPLYHIYGLNVVLNPALIVGATLVLMPRFDDARLLSLLTSERITFLPLVPPIVLALCHAAEESRFPRDHHVRVVKSGAAPLAAELARRFTSLTGIPLRQGYGMTEASPVTHMGYIEPEFYRPDSIGHPLALTGCKLISLDGSETEIDFPTTQSSHGPMTQSAPGELVMRGPQFMLGYWNAPEATAAVLRDGWYWSGDVATIDSDGFYRIVDRRKEMIKYKGFPIAPAEVEAVLLEHPAVRDCGVIGLPDSAAGEIPCAFVVLKEEVRDETAARESKLAGELCDFVAQRLSGYKQPRDVRFVSAIPRNPSGKILRRRLKDLL